MKKFIITLAFMMLALAACGGDGNTDISNNEYPTLPEQAINQAEPPASVEPEPLEQFLTEEVDGIFHQFDNLGFSVVFPSFWEGKYGFYEFEVELDFGTRYFVAVYHPATREELDHYHAGTIFTLGRSPRDHYTYDGELPVMAGGSILLAQEGGNTYFVNFPSGVEHSEDPNSESAIEYLEMVGHWEPEHWNFLVNSFRLID
ncbi:MAG: hypothetical protein FWC91_08055 [Defluviitaleaceae bacterium]|nr:hypothetical protein [Defluviitaleaceae bacterium]